MIRKVITWMVKILIAGIVVCYIPLTIHGIIHIVPMAWHSMDAETSIMLQLTCRAMTAIVTLVFVMFIAICAVFAWHTLRYEL